MTHLSGPSAEVPLPAWKERVPCARFSALSREEVLAAVFLLHFMGFSARGLGFSLPRWLRHQGMPLDFMA
jgi:hypothetical protein